MAKKMCDLCNHELEHEMRFGVRFCESCMETFEKAMKGDEIAIQRISDPRNYPFATPNARSQVIDYMAKRNARETQAPPPVKETPTDILIRQQNLILRSLEKQSNMIHTIKNCVVFFTTLVVIALVLAFISGL